MIRNRNSVFIIFEGTWDVEVQDFHFQGESIYMIIICNKIVIAISYLTLTPPPPPLNINFHKIGLCSRFPGLSICFPIVTPITNNNTVKPPFFIVDNKKIFLKYMQCMPFSVLSHCINLLEVLQFTYHKISRV